MTFFACQLGIFKYIKVILMKLGILSFFFPSLYSDLKMANIFYVKAWGWHHWFAVHEEEFASWMYKLQSFLEIGINKTGTFQQSPDLYKKIVKLSKGNFEDALIKCQTLHKKTVPPPQFPTGVGQCCLCFSSDFPLPLLHWWFPTSWPHFCSFLALVGMFLSTRYTNLAWIVLLPWSFHCSSELILPAAPSAACAAAGALQQAGQCLGAGLCREGSSATSGQSQGCPQPSSLPHEHRSARGQCHIRAWLSSAALNALCSSSPGCTCSLGLYHKRGQTGNDLSSSSCWAHLTWQGERSDLEEHDRQMMYSQ